MEEIQENFCSMGMNVCVMEVLKLLNESGRGSKLTKVFQGIV